jgi:hypothetical protein
MQRIIISFSIILILTVSSCKKIVEDVNVSPNSPTEAPSDLILAGAQVSSIVLHEGDFARLAGMWSQSFTGADRQYLSLNTYVTTSGDYDNTWSVAYRGVIAPCKIIIDKNTAINNKIMVGIAQVMQAHTFGTLTALFGDVPFKQAGDSEKFPSPVFDKQKDVYAGIQLLLDNAIKNLTSGLGVPPGTKDIFYGGDVTLWEKAAYTLKARYFLHTKEYAKAITAASKGISSASDNMIARHGEVYNSDFNLYYSFCVYDREFYMSAEKAYAPKLIDPSDPLYRGNAKTKEDARANYLYYLGGGLYFGGNELNVQCAFDGWVADPSEDGFFGGSTSFPLITFEENELIKAEANIRLNKFPEALSSLNDFRNYMNDGGYIGSYYATDFDVVYEPYEEADFATGGIENSGGTKNDALLKEIVEERYVTLIGQIEQFNDLRRTKNLIGLKPVTGTKLPQRFLYPQSEINANANTPKQTPADLYVPTSVNL